MNYYNDANRYDLDYDERVEDILFYLDKCRTINGEILELGSGTGRISIPLFNKGAKLTCIDNSDEMIGKALRKEKNLNIIKADFRNFNLNKKFDLIIMPFNAIQDLLTNVDVLSCLKCISEHLNEDGKFIFDINNPDFNELNRDPSTVMVYDVFKAYYEDGVLKRFLKGSSNINSKNLIDVVVEDTLNYDFETQIAEYSMFYSIDKKEDAFMIKLKQKMYFPQEVGVLLNMSKLHIIKKYGDFDKSKFSKNSPSQIFICNLK